MKNLQENNNGVTKDDIEKCIKLTSDLNSKKSENKNLEKENKQMKDSLADLQTKLTDVNNKLAEYQVFNTRLTEHNTQLMELVKGSKLAACLEKEHIKDKHEQEQVFTEKPQQINNSKSRSPPVKSERKCRFFENGYCKKNPCNFFHPSETCKSFFNYGQCPAGVKCRQRHPLNICMRFMNGNCNLGESCVHQHPVGSPSRTPPAGSQCSPNTIQSCSPLPYPPEDFQFVTPQNSPFSQYRPPGNNFNSQGASSTFQKQGFW